MDKILPSAFENFFINKAREHLYNTRGNSLDGLNSFTLHAIRTWNSFQNKFRITTSLPNLTRTKFLKFIKT